MRASYSASVSAKYSGCVYALYSDNQHINFRTEGSLVKVEGLHNDTKNLFSIISSSYHQVLIIIILLFTHKLSVNAAIFPHLTSVLFWQHTVVFFPIRFDF